MLVREQLMQPHTTDFDIVRAVREVRTRSVVWGEENRQGIYDARVRSVQEQRTKNVSKAYVYVLRLVHVKHTARLDSDTVRR